VLRTPLRRSAWLSSIAGADVYLKLETLQPSFSYKIRGAWNAVLSLEKSGTPPTVVTASAGNHGRGFAHAAAAAGLRLRVYVPATAPRIKVDAISAEGADVRTTATYDDAETAAKEDARRSGAVYVSPYSHPDVIAGAGTVALEILQDLPGVDTIVVPVGGGGLVSGVAIACQGRNVAVVGVEVEASCPFTRSLAAGRIVSITVGPTLADGLAGNLDPDTITFEIVRQRVARIAVVSEEALRAAIRGVVREERLIIEAAAAAGVAAVMTGRDRPQGERSQRVAVVLSGANIDPDKLREII